MLVIDVSLVNLRFDGRELVRREPGAPALILVRLAPQHVTEEVVPNAGAGAAVDPLPAYAAGPSTLAFSLPDSLTGIELSVASLLDWARLVPMPVPTDRAPDPEGTGVFDGIPRTVIEFPLRLLLTYDEPTRWTHRAEPFTVDGRTELWHTRLRGAAGEGVLLRAFAMAEGRGPMHDRTPLKEEWLRDIVTFTSRAELIDGAGSPIDVGSRPLHAEPFIVTPLGASAHLHGAWDKLGEPARSQLTAAGRRPPDLAAYDHITGLGRDQYIRAVTRGYLCTGHPALKVAETQRAFVAGAGGVTVALLQTEHRVIVQEPEVHYGETTGYADAGREMPFRTVRITDRLTPPLLDNPNEAGMFWVALADSGADHQFTVVGTDREGRAVSLTMPLIFIPDSQAGSPGIRSMYNDHPERADRTDRPLGGQQMAMAQPSAGAPGSTCHAVGSLGFELAEPAPAGGDHPLAGLLCLAGARVRVPAVEPFAPGSGDVAVTLNATYLGKTIDGHPAGAYLDLVDEIKLAFGAEKAGGLASPDAAVKLVTSRAGVLPDVFKNAPGIGETPPAGQTLPLDEIKKAFGSAKLLGFIDLKDILGDIPTADLGALRALGDQEIEAVLADTESRLPAPVLRIRDLDGQGRELRYVWKPILKQPDPPGMLDLTGSSLTLDARTVRSPDAVEQSSVRGALRDFALDFQGIARVRIASVEFTARPGCKPDVAATGLELEFRKELEFVNTLREALPADGFGKGAYVDVQPSGIRAGYAIALPALGIGVFSLTNVSLAAELSIPFDSSSPSGPVAFRFAISERQNPFNVSVSLLGGGGYFAMTVDATGVRQVEGAIEFGGNAALNLGVASGGVSIMAGIRFELRDAGKSVFLGGYLRCSGYLSVLGIITVSVEFYLELTYEKHGTQSVIRGRGTLTVSVRIAFFSKSVSLSLERSFSGAPGDPTFAECVEPPDWDELCAAFEAGGPS